MSGINITSWKQNRLTWKISITLLLQCISRTCILCKVIIWTNSLKEKLNDDRIARQVNEESWNNQKQNPFVCKKYAFYLKIVKMNDHWNKLILLNGFLQGVISIGISLRGMFLLQWQLFYTDTAPEYKLIVIQCKSCR